MTLKKKYDKLLKQRYFLLRSFRGEVYIMKNYERPVVLQYEDLAEGIYAASGVAEIDYANDTECWSMDITKDQKDAGGYSTFRISATHPGTVEHISERTVITVVFSRPVSNVQFEGFDVQVSGATATLTRVSHGNSYQSGDQFNSLMQVWSDDLENLTVVSSTIACTHQVNVQGKFD